ncbi:hypothetical protein ACFQX7_10015 [Luedemannella flava]
MSVLEMCADLLDQGEVDSALLQVFDYIDNGAEGRLRRRQASNRRRVEIALKTAAVLAPRSSHQPMIAEKAILLARELAPLQDEVALSALLRLIRAVSWQEVTGEVRQEWVLLLADPRFLSFLRPLDQANLSRALVGYVGQEIIDGLTGLERVVALINGWLGSNPSPSDATAAAEHCRNVLQDMVNEADRGAYSGRVYSPTQLSAYLIVEFDRQTLWGPLLEVISHPKVPATEKVSALGILSTRAFAIADDVRRTIAKVWAELPASGPDVFFSGNADELEAAWLKLLVAHDVVPIAELRLAILRLASNSEADVRASVAEVCSIAIAAGRPDGWLLLSELLQLSEDTSGVVRHFAARGLAVASELDVPQRDLARARLLSLLLDPGISTVLGVLKGFGDIPEGGKARGGERLWCLKQVLELSTSHPSDNVRRAAREVLGQEFGA